MYLEKLPTIEHRGLSPHTPGLDMSEKPSARASHLPTMSLPFTRQNGIFIFIFIFFTRAKAIYMGLLRALPSSRTFWTVGLDWMGLGIVPSRARIGRSPLWCWVPTVITQNIKKKNAIRYTKACKSLVYGYLTREINSKELEFNIFASLMDVILKWN